MSPTRFVPLALAATLAAASFTAQAQAGGPIKIGLMLPYSGTYAGLGNAIENGFKLYVQEQGGKLGGPTITLPDGRDTRNLLFAFDGCFDTTLSTVGASHVWMIDAGKVTHFREFVDTAAVIRAHGGSRR